MILNLLYGFIGLILLALIVGFLYETISAIRDRRRYQSPEGELVNVNGHALHIIKRGEREAGKPAIVLESRIGSGWLDWQRVLPQVAKFAEVVAYDRAGYGWSDSGSGVRDTQTLVSELNTLLHNAGVEPPYLLVGHSFGGLHVRAFAERYPDQIAGLILVESSHPEMIEGRDTEAEIRRLKNVQRFQRIGLVRLMMPRILNHAAYLDDEQRQQYLAMYLLDSANTIREAQPLFTNGIELPDTLDVPLTVLSRREDDDLTSEEKWAMYQHKLVELHPDARHIHAETASHFIMMADPETVVKAIRDLYEEL